MSVVFFPIFCVSETTCRRAQIGQFVSYPGQTCRCGRRKFHSILFLLAMYDAMSKNIATTSYKRASNILFEEMTHGKFAYIPRYWIGNYSCGIMLLIC